MARNWPIVFLIQEAEDSFVFEFDSESPYWNLLKKKAAKCNQQLQITKKGDGGKSNRIRKQKKSGENAPHNKKEPG
jgi:hypothetical protein